MRCLRQPAIPVPGQLQYPGYANGGSCPVDLTTTVATLTTFSEGVVTNELQSCGDHYAYTENGSKSHSGAPLFLRFACNQGNHCG